MCADRRVENSESEGDGRSMRVRQTDSRELEKEGNSNKGGVI